MLSRSSRLEAAVTASGVWRFCAAATWLFVEALTVPATPTVPAAPVRMTWLEEERSVGTVEALPVVTVPEELPLPMVVERRTGGVPPAAAAPLGRAPFQREG